jgi:CheY-like chemotaxis protein
MSVILVVDDNAMFARPIEMSLARRGHTVLSARDGRAALDLLRGQPVDLVLTDVAMPVMDGRELLAAIRREWPDAVLPVIFMTALAARDCVSPDSACAPTAYLLKSHFSLRDLINEVESHLPAAKLVPVPAA